MFMRDGRRLNGRCAAVFADELSAAVDSSIGSINHIFGANIIETKSAGGYLKQDKRPLVHTYQKTKFRKTFLKLVVNASVERQGA